MRITEHRFARIDAQWEAIGFVAVRPGQYMNRCLLTTKQENSILRGNRLRLASIEGHFDGKL